MVSLKVLDRLQSAEGEQEGALRMPAASKG